MVKPRIKLGLQAGIVGLTLNVFVASLVHRTFGLFLALVVGAAAGFLTAKQEKAPTKVDGARFGAVSGGIAGAFILIGQMIGALIGVMIIQSLLNSNIMIDPYTQADAFPEWYFLTGNELILYYVSQLGENLLLGVVGLLLAGLGGAGAAYYATPAPPSQSDR